jgi:hypothetical protein
LPLKGATAIYDARIQAMEKTKSSKNRKRAIILLKSKILPSRTSPPQK